MINHSNEEDQQSKMGKKTDDIPYEDEGFGQDWKSLSMKNHKHKSLKIYKQRDRTRKETQDNSHKVGESRSPIPPLDKPMDLLLIPSLMKEIMSAQVPDKEQLITEDKIPHNLSLSW
jgi:hypothetical protein